MNAEKIFGENVYVNLDEVIETVYQCRADVADREWEKRWLEPLIGLEKKEVSEEDELKFYYVDSIDAYWIGRRLDNFYYAEWEDRLGFVWSKSRYLPWGEHVVAPDTLWKEHTYPSEPREIPFTEWIVGFMKKHSVIPQAKEGEWIPCSERFPKDRGHYICSFVQSQRIDKIHIGLAYWDGRWVGYNASEINAWMPLPEPWKGTAE